MKTNIIRFAFAFMLSILSLSAMAQDGVHLSTYFCPASHDANPNVANVEQYRIYLTERNGQELTAIQSAVLDDTAALNSYVYICHPKFWNTDCHQYTTLDLTEESGDESLLDGRYEPTVNTLAVIVYNNGTNLEVLVLPTADEYFYEFFDDWEQPGTGWAEATGTNPPVAINTLDAPTFSAHSASGAVVIKGAQGKMVEIYDMMGRQVYAATSTSDEISANMPSTGMFVVRVNGRSVRVFVY